MVAFDVSRLNGWKQDTVGIQQTAREVGSIRQVARGLVGGVEQRDVHLWQALLNVKPSWRRMAQGIGDCFVENTLVTMGSGAQKRIQNVRIGEYVANPMGGPSRRVIDVIVKPYCGPVVSVIAGEGRVVCTPDHEFHSPVNRFESDIVAAQDLRRGRRLKTVSRVRSDGSTDATMPEITETLETFHYRGKVYCLTVEQDNCFYAGGFAVENCYAAGTIIAGPNTKPIEDVQVGDIVWSGSGKLTKVISTKASVSSRVMVDITPWGGATLSVTDDHKVLVYRMQRHHGKRVTANFAKRMKARSEASKKSAKWTVDRDNPIVSSYENREAQWVRAGDLRDTDCLLTPLEFEKDQVPSELKSIWSKRAGRYLLGCFLGDGATDDRTMSVACASLKMANRLTRIAANLGFSAKVDKVRDALCWVVKIYSSALVKTLRNYFYADDGQKKFPSFAVGDAAFVAGLWQADGFERKNANAIDSTSASIAYGVFNSLLMLGKQPTIRRNDRKKDRGIFANAKPIFRVQWVKHKQPHRIWKDDKYLCRPIRKIEYREGPHTVYDIGVADATHSIIANGVIGHNCVSWGAELAATMLMAIDALAGIGEWIEEAATESIYGGCRVEALGKTRGGRSDGAFGYAAAKWLKGWGVLLRRNYADQTGNREHDLTKYDARKAKEWGDYGCGGSRDQGKLDEVARLHPVKEIAQVKQVEEAIGCLYNGYPFTIASMAGFGDMRRDAEGLCRWVNQWAHQMMVAALRWRKGKPQFRVFQSWGDCVSGEDPGISDLLPKLATGPGLYLPSAATSRADFIRRLILPDPAFPYAVESAADWNPISATSWWIDEPTLAKILRTGDCWSFAGVDGFKPRKLDVRKAILSALN